MKSVGRPLLSIIGYLPLVLAIVVNCSSGKKDAAAIVNGNAISKEDLQLSLDSFLNQYKSMGVQLDSVHVDSLRHKILDSMVAGELLFQESRKAGFTVTDDDVSNEYQSMVEQYPSEQVFVENLTKQGLTAEKVKEQISRNLAIRKFVDEKISKEIVIPREEMEKYYEAHKDRYTHEEQVAARHIVIRADENDPPDSLQRKKETLEGVRKRALAGEDFSTLAKEYSEGPTAAKGGDLGYFSHGQMIKSFEDAAFALKPGETSQVIQTQYGFHIIQVYDRRPAGTSSFDEVEGSIEDQLKHPKINDQIEAMIEKLKSDSKIEILI